MKRLVSSVVFTLTLLLLPGLVWAQQGTITGTVTEAESGDPLPGATVQIPELGTGAATGPEGSYRITGVAAGEQTVRVSFVGFQTTERTVTVPAGGTVRANFELQTVEQQLDDVVVTAQQVQRQARSLGYSVSNVSTEDVTTVKEANLVNSLSGKISGVEITSQSGNVGGGSRIVLRGVASLDGDNQPLFVVDGTPVSNSNVDSGSRLVGTYDTGNKAGQIDPNSIESISVLKGGAAAALYGQRAKNGVVLIQTKSGEGQPASASFSTSFTASRPTILPDFQNQYGPGTQGKYDPDDTDGWGPRMEGQMVTDFKGDRVPFTPAPDNVSNFYDTGAIVNNSVSFSNSGDLGSFRLSASQDLTNGIVPNSELTRHNFSGTFSTEGIEDRLDAQLSVNFVDEETSGRQAAGGNDPNILVGIVNTLPRNVTADKLENNFQDEAGNQIPLTDFSNNPFWVTEKNVFTTDVQRVFGSVQVSFDVTDWLTLQEDLGTDIVTETRRERNRKTTLGAAEGEFQDQNLIQRQIDHDFTVRTDNELGDDFTLQTIVGHNINVEEFEEDINLAQNLNVDGLFNFANANSNSPTNFQEERRIIGVYGDVTLGFRNYAFLTFTGRNDWSSTLPDEEQSFFYPSVSASVVLTDLLQEEYDIDIPGVSYAKVRGNYAEVGSDEDPHQLGFDFIPVSNIFGQFGTDITFPFNGRTAFDASGTIPPTNLEPQRKESWEIGTELGLFDGRINLDFTYYNESTTKQILSLPIAEATGFSSRRTNIGTVENTGLELNLNAGLITTSNFAWRTSVNFTRNQNEVTELAPGVDEFTVQSGFNSLQIRATEGEELKFFGTGWARDPNTGKPIINPSTGLRQAGDDQELGAVFPDWKMGISNTIEVQNFALSFLVDWKQGGNVFSQTVLDLRAAGLAEETAQNRGGTFIDDGVIVEERNDAGEIVETRPNDVPVQSMEAFWGQHSDQGIIEAGLFDATYIKLRDVSLTYNAPQSWFNQWGVDSASLTLQGRNLLVFNTEVPHIDPETNLFGAGADIGQGVEFSNVPNTTTFGATLNFSF